ncbi:GTPase-activating protein CdGAPr isoform X3 [Phlebotomus papatasi]|uniref:GTPase-activating protein CdGAPr isoform X3 n=1 Tax=Phlebotomus papatasi TaxID=29031 RepID=UPI0024837474|nr:GTPase-activating protein CdGAPr isoform X3 [Phlebotomus papatasi]
MAEKVVSECEVGCDIAGELNSIMNSSQISSASSTDGQSKASIGIVHNVPGSSCRFPKLEECAHFHYERVQLAPIDVRLVEEKSEILSGGSSGSGQGSVKVAIGNFWFILRVSARESEAFLIKRSLENLKMLDEMLHQCVYNRQVSGLPCIQEIDGRQSEKDVECLVAEYFRHFSSIAPDSMTCGPVLTWFQLDNKGRRLPVADTDMRNSINTPAVGAAYGVRKYVSQACDEISIEVGDMISVIDMPSPAESIWWRGKKSHTQKSQYEVGFFPQNCVATIGEKIPRHMPLPAPLVGSLALSPTKPVLRKHGKLIAFFRSFILSRPSRRRLKASGIYKERVFSCDLSEHLLNSGQDIPMVLKCCAEFIEEYGIVDGIYRLSGITSNIQKLRRAFDEERIPDLQQSDIKQDIHAVSSLLKMYFRELPNPLCTYQLYDKFVEAIQSPEEGEDKLKIMRKTVQKLPPPHYRTLKYLATHLHHISRHSDRTGMTDRNLAIVWAPNLLRSPTLESGGVAALRGVGVQAVVTEYLITNSELIFNANVEFSPHSTEDSTHSRSSRDGESVEFERDHDSLSIERPKSLNVSGGTKLISLEEAQIRQNRIDAMDKTISVNSPHSGCMSYIEVGGGPSSLPDKYHTVLPVPRSWQKRKTHSWKSIFSRTPRQSNGSSNTPVSKDIRVILTPSQDEDDLKTISSPDPVTPLEEKSSISKAAEICDRKPMTMDICIRSNSVDSLRTTGHSRSVSHDSYFDLLQSPLRGIVNCPSRELSELGLNFDREEPEMRIFSESESLVSSPKVAKESATVSSVRRVLRARPEEFTSTANSVNPSPKKQPRLNCQSPNTWAIPSTICDESSCKRYKLEDQLSDIQFIDCGTPEHSTQYTSAQVHNPPDLVESPSDTPTPTTTITTLDDFLVDSPMLLGSANRFSYPQYESNKSSFGKYEGRFSYPGNGKNVKFSTMTALKDKPEDKMEPSGMEKKNVTEEACKNLTVTPPSSHHSPRYSLLVGETSSDNSSSVTTTPMFDVDLSSSTTKDSLAQNEKNSLKEMKTVDILALKRKFSLELEPPSVQMDVDGMKLQLPSTPNTPNFTQTSGNTSQSMTPSDFDYQQLNRGGQDVGSPEVSPRLPKSPEGAKKSPVKKAPSLEKLEDVDGVEEDEEEQEEEEAYEKVEFGEEKKSSVLETDLDDSIVYETVKFFKSAVSEVNQIFEVADDKILPEDDSGNSMGDGVVTKVEQQIVPDIDMKIISQNDEKTEVGKVEDSSGKTSPENDAPMPLTDDQDFDIKDSLEFDTNLSLYENIEMKKPPTLYENIKVESGNILMECNSTEDPPHPSMAKKDEKKPNNYLVKQLATKFETSPVENLPPFDFSKRTKSPLKNHISKPLVETLKVTRSLDENAFIWEFGPTPKLTEKFRNRSSQQIPEIVPPENHQRRKSLEFTRPKSLNPPKKLPDLTSTNEEICKNKLKMNKLNEEATEEPLQEREIKITPTTENRISLIQNNFALPCSEDRFNVPMRGVLGNYKLDRERIEKIKEERRLQLSEKFRSESFKSLERDSHPKSKSKSELRETKENDDSFRMRSKSRGEIQTGRDEKNRSEEFIFSSSLTRRIRRNNDEASSLDCGLNQRLSGKDSGLRSTKCDDFRERDVDKSPSTNFNQREKCSPQFSIKDVTAMFESRSQNQQ